MANFINSHMYFKIFTKKRQLWNHSSVMLSSPSQPLYSRLCVFYPTFSHQAQCIRKTAAQQKRKILARVDNPKQL